MTLILIAQTPQATLAHKGRIIKAEHVSTAQHANFLLGKLGDVIAEAKEQALAAQQAALAEENHQQCNAKLMALAVEADRLNAVQKSTVAHLALEVVRRIAPDIGSAVLLPAMIEKIVRELVQHPRLNIFVPSAALAPTRARLAAQDIAIDISIDETLSAFDCRIETPHGSIDGSLETQLSALEVAFEQGRRG